jgi:prolyl-tRNA editing enzyme YbaK/EbsC (Cys-tRNA(Pro) deacylase)
MARGSRRVNQFLVESGIDAQIVTLDDSTRTSQMAAEALGCSVAQIAKSIVFTSTRPIVVVVSGDMRVDPRKLSNLLEEEVEIADADTVKRGTGYVIGGVPPFPHDEGVRVVLDASLTRFKEVWTAAGTPNSVMKIGVDALRSQLGGEFVNVSKQKPT